MIVVDTNVIAYLYIPGDFTSEAEKVLERDSAWAAPLLWRSELRNVLTLYLRMRRLTLDTAIRIMGQAEALLRGREFAVASPEVLQRAPGCRLSAYDIEFLVLARDLGVKLVTTDAGMLQEFPKDAVSMKGFLSSAA